MNFFIFTLKLGLKKEVHLGTFIGKICMVFCLRATTLGGSQQLYKTKHHKKIKTNNKSRKKKKPDTTTGHH